MIIRVLSRCVLALCAVLLVLLAVDRFSPGLNLFLFGSTKVFVLAACVGASAFSVLLVTYRRNRLRRRSRGGRR